ncbi:2Fe-2S iron-sulfur cluster-binding protein [Arenicella xantha]|uniref:2Fe-2S ferredoxin n=1 Tax=Arenicella xantha TaxID=644221 RepID=A0A395JPW1_9GAMM|nr:2Fe-2S iron-sulfur cluster-binding protein [Arenicella xantha]RBP53547.1 2Fe-2S ferredoxin [Arenicella xantha]
MPNVTYIEHDGTSKTFDVPVGDSIMEGAIANDIDGIQAECGGAMACATCHVYVDPAWADKFPERSGDEVDMLECAEAECRDTSRLSCQLKMTGELDGVVIHLPESQY